MLPALLLLLLGADGGAAPDGGTAPTGMLCLKAVTWVTPRSAMVPENLDPLRGDLGAAAPPAQPQSALPSSKPQREAPVPMPYRVQVDDREPIDVGTTSVSVDGLDLATPHQIQLLGKRGRVQQKFKFSFLDQNGPRQALDFFAFYGSWGMRKAGKRECQPAR